MQAARQAAMNAARQAAMRATKIELRRLRRRTAAFVVATGVVTVLVAQAHAADPKGDPPVPAAASPEPEPRCHRDQDLACTLVRETPTGVWVWTERFRPAEATNSGWTLAVGAGPVSPVPVAHFVAPSPPPARTTPNGAPILE